MVSMSQPHRTSQTVPFYRNVRELSEHIDADVHLAAGDHTSGYWRRVLPAQLTWLGERLSAPDAQ